jgi:hypothetical protein
MLAKVTKFAAWYSDNVIFSEFEMPISRGSSVIYPARQVVVTSSENELNSSNGLSQPITNIGI